MTGAKAQGQAAKGERGSRPRNVARGVPATCQCFASCLPGGELGGRPGCKAAHAVPERGQAPAGETCRGKLFGPSCPERPSCHSGPARKKLASSSSQLPQLIASVATSVHKPLRLQQYGAVEPPKAQSGSETDDSEAKERHRSSKGKRKREKEHKHKKSKRRNGSRHESEPSLVRQTVCSAILSLAALL